MSNEERSERAAPRNGGESPAPQVTTPVDQAMWIDPSNPPYITSVTIPDATTFQDVTITAQPSDVLAANVAPMLAYAQQEGILLGQGPTI